MKERIKIILVDDHQVVLKGLISWLKEDEEIEVVGSFNNAFEALESLSDLMPHVVISDVRMPTMNGLELTQKILQEYEGEIKVVLVSGFYSEEYHITALEQGVSAFIPKDASYQTIINAIKQSYLGNVIIPIRLQGIPQGMRLTDKEKEVLRLIATGKKNDEISSILKVSKRTVEHHITNIFIKLDVDCRVSAVLKGVKLGIVENV